jgi:hypothetical protein
MPLGRRAVLLYACLRLQFGKAYEGKGKGFSEAKKANATELIFLGNQGVQQQAPLESFEKSIAAIFPIEHKYGKWYIVARRQRPYPAPQQTEEQEQPGYRPHTSIADVRGGSVVRPAPVKTR